MKRRKKETHFETDGENCGWVRTVVLGLALSAAQQHQQAQSRPGVRLWQPAVPV